MALVTSSMLPLGTTAPDFSLPDTISGQTKSLPELRSPIATVIMFICNHCPYVKHIQKPLVNIARDYQNKNISFIAINSNDIDKYPEDAPEKMREVAQQLNYPFPYLFDADQTVAKNYQAVCTPDFYLFDRDLCCVYRGQFDGSRPGNNVPVTGKDLTDAIDNLLLGLPVSSNQIPSMGCSIKWKSE